MKSSSARVQTPSVARWGKERSEGRRASENDSDDSRGSWKVAKKAREVEERIQRIRKGRSRRWSGEEEENTYERGQVVDRNDSHGRTLRSNVDVNGRFREGRVDRVDGEGVVRVGRAETVQGPVSEEPQGQG